MSLKQVKGKIKAVQKTGQVAKAMEAVSAAKMRKAEEWALSARPFAFSALKILKRLTNDKEVLAHHLVEREVNLHPKNPLFIVITSDRGLAGSLNSAILRELEKDIRESGYKRENISFLTIGRKAREYLSRRNFKIIKSLSSFKDNLPENEVREIQTIVEESFRGRESDAVYILYSNFINTFTQVPTLHQVFPIVPSEIEEILNSIRPTKGKYSDLFYKDEGGDVPTIYNFEPNTEKVLETILPILVETIIFSAALESKASEHSARMVAMKSANDKSKEVTKSLTREYNKERQSIITREMSEIVGGIEALSIK